MVPRRLLDEWTRGINGVSAEMRRRLSGMLARIDMSDMSAAAPAIKSAVRACCQGATESCAALAAEFYDLAREAEIGERLGAAASGAYNPEATDAAAAAIIERGVRGNVESMTSLLLDRVDYEAKRSSAVSVMRASRSDPRKPRYARVPTGPDTCKFCLMLASNGFFYSSARSAGEDGHYHAHCDCRIVPSWSKRVEGYDPGALRERWNAAMEADAEAAAERNGTTKAEELARERKRLNAASARAKERKRRREAAR